MEKFKRRLLSFDCIGVLNLSPPGENGALAALIYFNRAMLQNSWLPNSLKISAENAFKAQKKGG